MNVDGDVISIQIPDGAEPGDSLTFQAHGQEFTIEVPAASVAGDILQIKLANPTDEKDVPIEDTDTGVETSVDRTITTEMATGSKIRIVQGAQTKVSGGSISDGTYQLLWPASNFIVKFINTPTFCRRFLSSQVHSVIELGAGHGLLGIAFIDAASKSISTDKPMQLVLTDVEEAIPQLEANIRINREVLGKRVDMTSLPLKWQSQPISQINSTFNFILGSDLLYNCSFIPDLVATIRQLAFENILLSVRNLKVAKAIG